MTTGVCCGTRGCGGIVPKRGDKCTNCGIEGIRNPLWRSIRRAVHNTLNPDLPATDHSGIVWHKAASTDALMVRCNDAPTGAEASALDRQAAGASVSPPPGWIRTEPAETAPGWLRVTPTTDGALGPTTGGRPESDTGYGGPAVKPSGDQSPGWWLRAPAVQKEAWRRMDEALAGQLGYDRPYAHGPNVGTCPGTPGSQRGHGLTMRTVHGGACCERWDEAREAAVSAGIADPTETDRQQVAEQQARYKIACPDPAATAGYDMEASG